MRVSRTISRAAGLVACAAVVGALANLAAPRERRLSWLGPASASPGRAPAAPTAGAKASAAPAPTGALSQGPELAPHPDRAWVEIDEASVERLHRQGALFLDARRTSVYRDGHIPGARSFPVWESDIDARVKALFDEGRDQRAPIVAYCSGGDCEDSHMLAEKLYFVGFDDVLVYKDGFPDWQRRGLPISKGERP